MNCLQREIHRQRSDAGLGSQLGSLMLTSWLLVSCVQRGGSLASGMPGRYTSPSPFHLFGVVLLDWFVDVLFVGELFEGGTDGQDSHFEGPQLFRGVLVLFSGLDICESPEDSDGDDEEGHNGEVEVRCRRVYGNGVPRVDDCFALVEMRFLGWPCVDEFVIDDLVVVAGPLLVGHGFQLVHELHGERHDVAMKLSLALKSALLLVGTLEGE